MLATVDLVDDHAVVKPPLDGKLLPPGLFCLEVDPAYGAYGLTSLVKPSKNNQMTAVCNSSVIFAGSYQLSTGLQYPPGIFVSRVSSTVTVKAPILQLLLVL